MRTRLRRLHLNGRTFCWRAEIRHVPGSTDCHRCIRVRVWGAGKSGRVLQADLLSTTPPGPWGACATDSAHPTPGDVRKIIICALACGWDPDLRGGTFHLTEHEHAPPLRLPEFLITDRLRNPDAPDPTRRVAAAHEQRTHPPHRRE